MTLRYHFRTQLNMVTHLGSKGIAKPDKQSTALGMHLRAVGRKEDERPLFCQEPDRASADGMFCTLNIYFHDSGSGKPIPKHQVI